MTFNHMHYVPCLKWKMGEYHAVSKLADLTKEAITPLIEAPGLEWDFEEKKNKKTIEEVLPSFSKRICDKWRKTCFIDVQKNLQHFTRMTDGQYPEVYVFNELRAKECQAIPVIEIESDLSYTRKAYLTAIKSILNQDGMGVSLRVNIEQIAKASFKEDLSNLMSVLAINFQSCDLILDLVAPNYIPIDGISMLLSKMMGQIPNLSEWRTVVILGSSFPGTMAGVTPGLSILPRHEWSFYKKLVDLLNHAKVRLPSFGDYPIAHPKTPNIDMRMIKPSATIRYTCEDGWCLVKGGIYRDDPKQFYALSKQLVVSKYFSGAKYSHGDAAIENCANKLGGPGSLTSWREYGTNHHVEYVVQDIAKFYAAS